MRPVPKRKKKRKVELATIGENAISAFTVLEIRAFKVYDARFVF